MIYKLLNFIQLFLPYGLILNFYKNKKAAPINLKTSRGYALKVVMITNNYGIVVAAENYIKDRLKKLKDKQEKVNAINEAIANEVNSLTFEAREAYFKEELEEDE